MEEFLNAIIANSKNYINWNTDNGVQNYIARALPSEQFLITISCTFQDVAIDRDLGSDQEDDDGIKREDF